MGQVPFQGALPDLPANGCKTPFLALTSCPSKTFKLKANVHPLQ